MESFIISNVIMYRFFSESVCMYYAVDGDKGWVSFCVTALVDIQQCDVRLNLYVTYWNTMASMV